MADKLVIVWNGRYDPRYLFEEAVEELALEAEIEKVEDLIEIVKLGVMSAPSIMIDGKVVISGQVPTKEKIKKILERVML